MSFTLFKNTFKRNWVLLLIFGFVLCMYLGIIIMLIEPADMAKIQDLFGVMGGMLPAFGIDMAAMTNPLSYTASTFYGLMVMAFTMVFYVIQVGRLIAKPVDTGSMAYTLSMPISRAGVALTQGVYLVFAMLVHALAMFGVGTAILSTMSDYMPENWVASFLQLVAVTFCLTTAMAMLSYFFSVAFCDSKLGVSLATGVPIAFLLMSMLGGAGGKQLEWLKKITPFGWLESVDIVNGKAETWWMYLVFGAAIVALLAASVLVFRKKRLPI